MKRFLPLIIIAGIIAALAVSWALFGGRALSLYYTLVYQNAWQDGRGETAADAMEKLVALRPDDRSLRRTAAELLSDIGSYSRAEYHLKEAIALGGPQQPSYIAALSALYVSQDKLMDAVALLDGVSGLPADAVQSQRPAAPELNPPPGVYQSVVTPALTLPEGCTAYYSVSQEYPSLIQPWDGALILPMGETTLRIVAVSADGMVSALWTGVYTLENINYPVEFADPSLEALLRAAISKPEGAVYSRELTEITELRSGEAAEYATLDDLLHLPRLRVLELTGMETACDISALAALTSIAELRLTGLAVDSVDLTALTGLTTLRHLTVTGAHVTSLTPLERLTALETLDLSHNAIIDPAPLAGMTGLKRLTLAHNSLQALSALASLTALEELDLAGNRITSLAGLESMTRLTTLVISDNYLEILTPIKTLKQLTHLDASNNKLTELDALESLSKIEQLDLSGNLIAAIAPLGVMDALHTLRLQGNEIESLGALADCTALVTLDVSKNAVTSVEALRGLPKLSELRIESNKVTKLAPLTDCPALKAVYAFGNSISDTSTIIAAGITVY